MSRLSTLATVLLASIGYHGQVSEQQYARRRYSGFDIAPVTRSPPSNGARECGRRRRQIEAGTLQVSK